MAACPMLQSMENAAVGSHLEVRLASDIKQESINTFLQYLYEGFMLLTEENCKDVEKIGRLLQVDSVIKCVADFHNCMSVRTGTVDLTDQYRFDKVNNSVEFRHVRSSEMLKTSQDRTLKREPNFPHPASPGHKRPRFHRSTPSPLSDDTVSMSQSYANSDHWEGVSRSGSAKSSLQPGVVDIVEDGLELVHTNPAGSSHESRSSQNSMSVGISSRIDHNRDTQIINVSENARPVHPVSMRSSPSAKGPLPPSRSSDFHPSTRPSDFLPSSRPPDFVPAPRPPELQLMGNMPRDKGQSSASHESRGDSQHYVSPLQSMAYMKAPSSSASASKSFAVGSPNQSAADPPSQSRQKSESGADKSEARLV